MRQSPASKKKIFGLSPHQNPIFAGPATSNIFVLAMASLNLLLRVKLIRLRFYHRLIIVTQFVQGTTIAAWAIIHANALSMSQKRLMKVVNTTSLIRQQGLQERMGCIGRNLFANQRQAYRHAMHMRINRQYRQPATKEENTCRCFRANSLKTVQPCCRLFYRHATEKIEVKFSTLLSNLTHHSLDTWCFHFRKINIR